ncbi:peptide ABC transporter substrate-binding protein [Roseburia hominis]|uniref:peptide ABC transporter substrate-binding protein n=1 Tax=Roseburia hominis TaxID=301301 RepID=UPI001F390FA1|nr:peptide ABC transporter substrate-binding protein [Roseburia hominis]
MKKKLVSAMLVAAMAVSMLAGCGSSASSSDSTGTSANSSSDAKEDVASTEGLASTSDGTTLRINLASEPDKLDPALNSSVDGAALAANSFVGLFVFDENSEVQPALCDSYTVSEDGLTYVFTLKDGLKWSDGSDLTAADFEYSWKRAANPETAADYSYLFDVFATADDGLINVKADGNTLTATLNAPCPYFLQLCAFPAFMPVPQAAVEAANADGTNPGAWCQEAGFVSNGAFTCTEWKHNESMVYTKNPYYYDADNVKLEKLEYMLSADDTAIFSAYNAGDLDFIDTVPTDEVQSVINNDDFYVVDQLGNYYLQFNVNADMFDGMSVEDAATLRHALGILIDRDYIVTNIGQTGQHVATAFVPEEMSDGNGGVFRENEYDYPDKDSNGYFSAEYDFEAAKAEAQELLESIGYEFDDQGMLSADTPISLEFLLNEGSGNQAIAEAIQSDWSSIGIECNIKTEEWDTFINDRKAGAFSIARGGWVADYSDPINMLEIFTSDSGNNDTQFGKDPSNTAAPDWTKYDELINQIRTTTDLEGRVAMMHEAEDMLMDTWAVVPLYYYNDLYMCKTNVSGVYSDVFGTKHFQYATIN